MRSAPSLWASWRGHWRASTPTPEIRWHRDRPDPTRSSPRAPTSRRCRERSFAETLYHPAAAFWKAARRGEDADARRRLRLGARRWLRAGSACDPDRRPASAEVRPAGDHLGIIPGGGGTQRLARVLGRKRAMELVLTGRRINAKQAHELGLVKRGGHRRSAGWQEAMELAQTSPEAADRGAIGEAGGQRADETALSAGLEAERRLTSWRWRPRTGSRGCRPSSERSAPKAPNSNGAADGQPVRA